MLRATGICLLIALLTALTQVGGIILLLCIPVYQYRRAFRSHIVRVIYFPAAFLIAYLLFTLIFIPLLAQPFGRVPLPVFGNDNLKPLTLLTCLLNRHYVTPEMRTMVSGASDAMENRFPGTVTSYLDANFPFLNGFPLIPHLSHDDGRKLDLAFYYTDAHTQQQLQHTAPSWIGYGVYTDPQENETNMPEICRDKGNRQYSFARYLAPQGNKEDMLFDTERTKALVTLLSDDRRVHRIFIEPHLKERMRLESGKVRFHGCHAVRHDDHVHVEIR